MVRPFDDPEKLWPVYGVNNQEGVFLSHYQKGEKFNASYKRIEAGWFFHNPTRANVGSMGRVPNVEPDAITSPEYQVWRICDSTVLPDYIEILIQMPFFNRLVQVHRVGAVKQRLFVRNLMEIRVPRASLDQQRQIVQQWREAEVTAETLRREAGAIEQKGKIEFLHGLGLKPPKETSPRKCIAVRSGDMDRWGVSSCKTVALGVDVDSGTYPVIEAKHCIRDVMHGCSASPSPTPSPLRVLRISAVTRGKLDIQESKFAFDSEKFRRIYDLRAGDVLLCRTNGTLAYVGQSALVKRDQADLIFPDKVIRVRLNDSIEPAYFWFLLQTPHLRAQIEAAARTAVGNYAIGGRDIWELRIPLPPNEIQQSLVAAYASARTRAASLRAQVEATRAQALAQVEAAILGRQELSAAASHEENIVQ